MTETPAAVPPADSRTSPLLVILGILFILIWLTLAATWAGLTLMAALMANDSGQVSESIHTLFLVAVFGGEALTTIAGFPAAMAIFWTGKRKLLWTLFAIPFVTGALLQAGAAYYLLYA